MADFNKVLLIIPLVLCLFIAELVLGANAMLKDSYKFTIITKEVDTPTKVLDLEVRTGKWVIEKYTFTIIGP